MKKFLLFLPAIALLFAGCTKQEIENATDQLHSDEIVLRVAKAPVSQGNAGDPTMRTFIDINKSPMTTSWISTDTIALSELNTGTNPSFAGNNPQIPFAYTGPGGDDASVGDFKIVSKAGSVSNDKSYIAVYPYIDPTANKLFLMNDQGITQGNTDLHIDLDCQIHSGNAKYENLSPNAFMYSEPFSMTKYTVYNDPSGFSKQLMGPELNLNNAMSILKFTISGIPTGTKLYQISVTGPAGTVVMKRTFVLSADGSPHYTINPTPAIVLFADDGTGGGMTYSSDMPGTYSCAMVVVPIPGLTSSDYLNFYIRTFNGTDNVLSGTKLIFPNGIVASYFYSINLDWSKLATAPSTAEKWKGGNSYTLPYIKGNNIIIRTAAELAWVAGVVNRTNDINEVTAVPMYDLRGLTPENEPASFQFAGYTITLANDIDMDNKPFTPIGSKKAYMGNFYGNGHKIINFTPQADPNASENNKNQYNGLFRYTDSKSQISGFTVNTASY